MKFYQSVEYPAVPAHLISDNYTDPSQYQTVKEFKKFDYGQDHYWQGEFIPAPEYCIYTVKNQDLIDWVKQNVSPNYAEIQLIVTRHKDQGRMIVHTDMSRKLALNYIINAGGNNVKTNWFQEHDKPVIRSTKPNFAQTDTGFVEYDNLDLLDSVECNANSWTIIRTDVLHDVSNISGNRTFLSIKFSNDYEQELLKTFD